MVPSSAHPPVTALSTLPTPNSNAWQRYASDILSRVSPSAATKLTRAAPVACQPLASIHSPAKLVEVFPSYTLPLLCSSPRLANTWVPSQRERSPYLNYFRPPRPYPPMTTPTTTHSSKIIQFRLSWMLLLICPLERSIFLTPPFAIPWPKGTLVPFTNPVMLLK